MKFMLVAFLTLAPSAALAQGLPTVHVEDDPSQHLGRVQVDAAPEPPSELVNAQVRNLELTLEVVELRIALGEANRQKIQEDMRKFIGSLKVEGFDLQRDESGKLRYVPASPEKPK